MEKRKSKRCPTVSGEISPLRFFKNEIALSEFFGGTERIRVSAVLQKKGKRKARTNVGGKQERKNRRSEGEKAERARERRSERGVQRG